MSMRRRDKEINDRAEMESILRDAVVLHIALVDGDWPYIIPVNFGFRENFIYIHCAGEGKKLDLIRRNPRAAFQAETGVEVVHRSIPAHCGTLFRSVSGKGRASIVESREEKRLALQALMDHYNRGNGKEWEFGECLDEVWIIRIEIESLTGKASVRRHID